MIDGDLVTFWTTVFLVPMVGSCKGKSECETKSMFRKNRFGQWPLICTGLEQKVRARL